MLHALLRVALAVVLANVAFGQLVTTTNDLGLTVVEEITLNPLQQETTITLETITTPLTTATTTAPVTTPPTTATTAPAERTTTTTPPPQVVEQPAATAAVAEPTVYVYTTTNAAGGQIVETATFTPSFAPTTTPTPTGSGTILQYSQWLSLVGTSTVASGALPRWRFESSWLAMGVATLTSLLGGAWLTLA